MDKPISVGDLVVISRTCCDEAARRYLGLVFKVTGFDAIDDNHCEHCGSESCCALAHTGRSTMPLKCPVPYLTRIPPAEELGIVDEREPIREIASH